jgi:hypothetical protein
MFSSQQEKCGQQLSAQDREGRRQRRILLQLEAYILTMTVQNEINQLDAVAFCLP